MSDNVFEVLRQHSPQLIVKLDENHDICTFLMGVYAHLLHIAADSSKNPKNMRTIASVERGRLLVIKVSYEGIEEGTSASIATKLPSQRNLNLVRLLEVNRSVRDLALNIVFLLERWVTDPRYNNKFSFKDVRAEHSMLWRGEPTTFTAELLIKAEFDNMANDIMGWEQDTVETEDGDAKKITNGSNLIQ